MGARWTLRCLLTSIATLLIAACSNGTGSVEERPATQTAQEAFTLSGTVTGLSGQGLVLQNNGGADLAITANGGFTFSGSFANASSYSVTVRSQPTNPAQVCTVRNGSGSISANVSDISITCNNSSGAFAVRGTVSGLAGSGLVLRNNGTDDLAITANGSFSFPLTVPSGAPYSVTVRTQPTSPAQTCTISNAAGTMGSGDVTNVSVTCSAGSISIGGTVTGLLSGSSVGLANNGTDSLTVTQNGQFVFSHAVAIGSRYFVTVSSNPTNPPQSCTVTNGSNTAGTINVTDIVITCSTNYTVGGSITGLLGSGLTLQLSGANDLTIPAGMSSFAFGTFLSNGAAYNVTVRTQPSNPAQTCTVSNGSGTIAAANVTNVAVTCVIPTHVIGGTVSGLRGANVVLRNNGQDLTIRSDGQFTFPTRVQFGATYNVQVQTQPTSPQQICSLANSSGTVSGDVRNIQVTCATTTYALSVNVTELRGSAITLYNNRTGTPLQVPRDGRYTFVERVANGSPYEITVDPQPSTPTQFCAAPAPEPQSGTMGTQDLTVNIVCTTSMFTVGGTVNNLVGSTGLLLQNRSNGEQLTVTSSPFAFLAIASGSSYDIQVVTQPSNPVQVCSVLNGTGTVTSSHRNDIRIDCVTTQFTIGGQVSNLVGSGLVLQNNGTDNLSVATTSNSPTLFTFTGSLPPGTAYNVVVETEPSNPGQVCAVANGTGTMGTSNVNNVQVTCTTVEFTVGGTVTGLSGIGPGVLLQNNGGDTIEVSADGAFTFPVRVRTAQAYNVTVFAHPTNPARLCSVTGGAGIMGSAAVGDVTVFCIALPFFP